MKYFLGISAKTTVIFRFRATTEGLQVGLLRVILNRQTNFQMDEESLDILRDKRNSERFVVSQRLKVSIMFSQHAGKFKEKMTLTSNSLIYSSGILL